MHVYLQLNNRVFQSRNEKVTRNLRRVLEKRIERNAALDKRNAIEKIVRSFGAQVLKTRT